MLQNEIVEGKVYRAKVSGQVCNVRVDEIVKHEGWRGQGLHHSNATTHYACTNLDTGRQITIKSAMEFRREVIQ